MDALVILTLGKNGIDSTSEMFRRMAEIVDYRKDSGYELESATYYPGFITARFARRA